MPTPQTTRLRRFANSLVVRLLALAIFTGVLGLIGRTVVLSNIMQSGVEKLVSSHLMSAATYVAADIDNKIRTRRQFLETLAQDFPKPLLGRPQQLETWLAERHRLNPLFPLGLVVVPADGKGAIADAPPMAGRRQLDFSASDWLLEARDKRTFAIAKPVVGRVMQQGIIILAAPIIDAHGQVAAVIYGATKLDAPGFLDLIQDNPIGRTGGYLLISPRDNLFVAATMPKMRLRPLPPPGVNEMHDHAMAGFRGTGIAVNAFDVEELVAIASVPAAGWFVVARMPTIEAFEPVAEIRAFTMRNSAMLTVGVVFLLIFFLRHMFRPLADAARQMRHMADDKAPLEPLPVVRHDEVGEMVEGFNYLLGKLRESEARMAHLAHHDNLTGLPNRMSFLDSVAHGTALAKRHGTRLALMFIDLDGFKPINDRHGHDVGDQLLQQVATRLGESVRESDIVARFGGDEFVVLLDDAADPAAIGGVAEKIIARLSAPYRVEDLDLAIGASVGIALFPDDAGDVDALIAQADAAMYEAKRAGRGCHRFAG